MLFQPSYQPGHLTKLQVGILIEKYRDALDLSNRTGFGDTTQVINGVEVPVTALAQLKAVCPHWEIFDTFMRSEFESINPRVMGLTEGSPQGTLKLSESVEVEAGQEDLISEIGETITLRRDHSLDVIDPILRYDEDPNPAKDTDNESNSTDYGTQESNFELTSISQRTPTRKDQLLSPQLSPIVELDDEWPLSGSDVEEKENLPKSTKTLIQKRDLLSAIQDVRDKGVKRRKTKLEQDIDIYNKALETRNKRLTVDELKYRARVGEKSKEQRQHELALMELEVKKEQYKKEMEELRWKQLKYQYGRSTSDGDA